MDHLCGNEGESEDGDVVLLAEALRGLGNGLRRVPADISCPVEAKELAGGILRLDNAIGEEGECIARREREG